MRKLNHINWKEHILDLAFEMIICTTQCKSVGIRVKSHNDYPFARFKDFEENHLIKCNHLVEKDENGDDILVCICGRVINRKRDGFEDMFTEHGSFYSNGSDEILQKAKEAINDLRKYCTKTYQSLGLIPVCLDNNIHCLFYIADKKPNLISHNSLGSLEKIATTLSLMLLDIDNEGNFVHPHQAAKHTINVLIVDDNHSVLHFLEDFLQKCSYKTTTASNGNEALKLLFSNKFDILVSDIEMPGMNGIELVQQMKNKLGIYSPKVILMSGIYNPNTIDESKESGVKHFLLKPFSPEEVEEAIIDLLSNESDEN